MAKKLTAKERKFVELYLGRCIGNGRQAAIGAGYPEKSAHVLASRLLRKVNIAAEVERRQAKAPEVADRQRLQQLFSDVALGKDKFADAELGHRLRAAELLGKSHRMFIDRVDVNHFDHEAYLADEEQPAGEKK